MPSPFPGMDPFLEDPNIFPDFLHGLASGIANELNRRLPGPLYTRIDVRSEVGIIDEEDREHSRSIIPDFLILRAPYRGGSAAALEPTEVVIDVRPRADLSRWIDFDRLGDELVRHPFVEIRDPGRGHKLITLIEILSPSNKRMGSDRMAYEAKQREVIESDANLIEIDLLRDGRRVLPNVHLLDGVNRLHPRPDYLVLVSRASARDSRSLGYIAFPFGVRDPLPCIPVPLRPGDAELPLDIQFIFRATYDAGPYRRGAVDYDATPSPPLPAEDAEWAATLLRA